MEVVSEVGWDKRTTLQSLWEDTLKALLSGYQPTVDMMMASIDGRPLIAATGPDSTGEYRARGMRAFD
jgi:hypothetical protein